MELTGIPSLEVVAALVAGGLATVGALVAFGLAMSAVHAGMATAGRFVTDRLCAAQIESRTGKSPAVESSLPPMPDPALYSRQAWWRIRC